MFFLDVVDIKIAGSELFSRMYMAPYSISNHFHSLSLSLSRMQTFQTLLEKSATTNKGKIEVMRD
jgi:hypothetical protein